MDTCPAGSHYKTISNGIGGIGGLKCVSDNPTSQTPAPKEVEVPKNPDGTCPAGSHIVGFGGKTGSGATSGSKCISDNPTAKTTTTPATGTTTTPATGTTTTPATVLQHQLQVQLQHQLQVQLQHLYHYKDSYRY